MLELLVNPLGDSRRLRFFRLFYLGSLACLMPSRVFFFANGERNLFQGFLWLPSGFSVQWFVGLHAILLCTFLVLAAFEFFPRLTTALALLTLLNVLQPTEAYLNPYDSNIIFFNLLALCFVPSTSTSKKMFFTESQNISLWPLQLIKFNLALVYFSAFISKMVNGGGLFWANGTTMQSYIMERYLMTGSFAAEWLAHSYLACLLLSIFTLIAESTFWTVLLPTRLSPYIAFSGLVMHIGIFVFMGINFRYFVLTYLVFIPYEKLSFQAIKRLRYFH